MKKSILAMAAAVALAVPTAGLHASSWTFSTLEVTENTPDGHVDLKVSVPVLANAARPVAQDAINRALRAASNVEQLKREAAEARQQHEAALKKGGNPTAEDSAEDPAYSLQVDCEVGLLDSKFVSICFTTSGFTGGMMAQLQEWEGCTFSAETGKALDLADLFGADWQAQLLPLLKEYLQPGAAGYYKGWEAKLVNLDNTSYGYYLRPGVLVVFFQKYSIAPGDKGIVSVEIPLERMGRLVLK